MDIRTMKYFLMVAREENITHAARLLHISQPSLSQSMQQLEDEFGKKFFVRGNRNVTLTEDGIYLQKKIEEILRLTNKLEKELGSTRESIHGDIYIGSGETAAFRCIARVIKKMRNLYPDILFHIYSGDGDINRTRLESGLFDFAVLLEQRNLNRYNYIRLPYEEAWGLYMNEYSHLAGKDAISYEDLRGLPLILPDNQDLFDMIRRWSQGEKLNIASHYTLLYNATLMVKERLGYIVAINGLCPPETGIVWRPFFPSFTDYFCLVWKKEQPLSKAAAVFLRAFKEELQSIRLEEHDKKARSLCQ